MKTILLLLVLFCFMSVNSACTSKNDTVRIGVKKKVNEYLSLGITDYRKGKFTTAKVFLDQALSEAYSIDSVSEQINLLQILADVNIRLDDIKAASNSIFRAIEIAKAENNNYYNYDLYIKLGKYYDKIAVSNKDYEFAFDQFNKALKFASSDDQKANCFGFLGINLKKQNKLDEAIKYINKAREINEWGQDFDGLGDNFYTLGEIEILKENYQKALEYHTKSLMYDKTSENSAGIMENLKKIGIIYMNLKDNTQALNYLYRAFYVAKSIDNPERVKRIQELISGVQNPQKSNNVITNTNN